jgi:hypothetical protein
MHIFYLAWNLLYLIVFFTSALWPTIPNWVGVGAAVYPRKRKLTDPGWAGIA